MPGVKSPPPSLCVCVNKSIILFFAKFNSLRKVVAPVRSVLTINTFGMLPDRIMSTNASSINSLNGLIGEFIPSSGFGAAISTTEEFSCLRMVTRSLSFPLRNSLEKISFFQRSSIFIKKSSSVLLNKSLFDASISGNEL